MVSSKTMDCVDLKNSIQKQLLKEHEGMDAEKIRNSIHHKLKSSNSPVAKLWRYLEEKQVLKKAG